MELVELVNQVEGFDGSSPAEKIRLFGWYLHTHQQMHTFRTGDIRGCFEELHLHPPNIAMYLIRMTETRPPKALRSADTYKLSRAARNDLDAAHGAPRSFVQISKLLSSLPEKVPDLAEKTFLTETINCYRAQAYRASIVMAWNLAFDHLLRWILADASRLELFNSCIIKRFPKKIGVAIVAQKDFEDLKESEVIEICNTANLISGSTINILREKLTKRNTAAHPSLVVIVQSQADDVITDLVNNVVMSLQ